MKKIRIAQIGTGHDHAAATIWSIDRCRDVFDFVGYAVGEDDYEKYEEEKGAYTPFKRYTVEEILSMDDLDAVAIETTELSSVKYAQMAADRGLHVHLDKPGNESAEEFETLLSTIKKKGLILSMGYMYRFNPAVVQALQQARAGELGEIYAVEAHMDCSHPQKKRQWLSQFQGGMTFYLGCHLIDLVMNFKGVPDSVIPYNTPSGVEGVTAKDNGFVVLLYDEGGASFIKTCSAEAGGFMRRQLVVCGAKSTVTIQPIEAFTGKGGSVLSAKSGISSIPNGATNAPWNNDFDEKFEFEFDRYDPMMRNFAERVCSGEQGEYTLEYEARLHRVILASCGIDCDYKGEINL